MDKRSTKILVGCILCTLMVLCLFLIVFRFTQLSCELVSIDPVRLASSQAAAFAKEPKPIRSYDETILMRISAYLEYNIQPEASDPPSSSGAQSAFKQHPDADFRGPTVNNSASNSMTSSGGHFNATQPSFNQQPFAVSVQNQQQQSNNNNSNQNKAHGARPASQQGPAPSNPQLGSMNAAPQHNGSSGQSSNSQWQQFGRHGAPDSPKAERRFLPLELRSIETRNMEGGAKHKYILNFNCTKLNMVVAHQNNRVYVESMNLELRPESRQEATCEVQLPATGAFMVADSTSSSQSASPPAQQQQQQQQAALGSGQAVNGTATANLLANTNHSNQQRDVNNKFPSKLQQLAHYYCNKPLRYSCYHYNTKSGPSQSNGLLLVELHINGIEFETSTSWQGKHKKVKSEFKSKRSECNIV